ncbi:monocarboxylate transporter 7-like [Strongylocentrotus purpuratus]|uniref:Monocarboxylate transporter n=1 Tax=Strongylocentrotus purpuratus TaxID=7668 RepID=A0A7M7T385_STRPU|nr:monocarboxylate transporter 7-like [Strongylocentrotus purpuratus]
MESSRGQEISILNWKWGYVIVLCKFMTNMAVGITKAFGVLLPVMVERFNRNYATVGFICSLPGTIMLFSGPFVSLVLQRVDHRIVAMLGGVISGTFLVSCGFISNITGLGFTLALTGIGRCCAFLPIALLMNQYFKENFVLMNTIASYGSTVGVMFLPVIAERSLEAYGYSGVFMILGAIMFHKVAGGAAIRKPIFSVNDNTTRQSGSEQDPSEVIRHEPSEDDDEEDGIEGGDQMTKLKDELRDDTDQGPALAESRFHTKENLENTETLNAAIVINDTKRYEEDKGILIDDDNEEHVSLLNSACDHPGEVGDLPDASRSGQDDSEKYNLCSSFISRCKLFMTKEALFLMCLPATYLRAYSFEAWVLYLVPHAEQIGITPSRAVFLSSIGGIGGIIGRTIAVILLVKKVHMFKIYIIVGCIASLSFFFDFVGESFIIRSVWAFLQGLCFFVLDTADATFLKLTLVDESNFSFGLGLVMLIHGSGNISAGLLTGALFDVIQSYTIVFMMIGIPVLFFTINVVVISVLLNRRVKSKHV